MGYGMGYDNGYEEFELDQKVKAKLPNGAWYLHGDGTCDIKRDEDDEERDDAPKEDIKAKMDSDSDEDMPREIEEAQEREAERERIAKAMKSFRERLRKAFEL